MWWVVFVGEIRIQGGCFATILWVAVTIHDRMKLSADGDSIDDWAENPKQRSIRME